MSTTTRELTVIRPAAQTRTAEWHAAARRARLLSWLSLVWMGAEGAIAITAGILAGSIALIGFGIDSAIEGFASLVIVWRFTGARLLSHAAEERAQKLVAIQFFLLAPYVAFEAVHKLVTGEQPRDELARDRARHLERDRDAAASGSPSAASPTSSARSRPGARAPRTCSAPTSPPPFLLACSGTRYFGLWWLDPVAALVVAAVAVKEGRESRRGEGCCAAC